jgi:hypothetical protein
MQVTANGFQSNEGVSIESDWGNDSSNPALGLAWTHCVNTRIRLRRDSSCMRSIAPDYDVNGDIDDEWESSSNGGQTPHKGVEDTTGGSSSSHRLLEDAEQDLNRPHKATGETVSTGSSRLFTLELSPCHHKSSCRYDVTNDGVFGQS